MEKMDMNAMPKISFKGTEEGEHAEHFHVGGDGDEDAFEDVDFLQH
jgi:hypothetical protein